MSLSRTGVEGRVHQTLRQLFHPGNVAGLHREDAALRLVAAFLTGHAETCGGDPRGTQNIGVGGAAGFGPGRMFFAFDEFPRPHA